jgi:epoxyqueuosine reductase QueG
MPGATLSEVLGEKLRALLFWIKEECPEAEARSRGHQPIMDKAWAARAGTGLDRQTHKSNLLNSDRGSLWASYYSTSARADTASKTCSTCLCLDACRRVSAGLT